MLADWFQSTLQDGGIPLSVRLQIAKEVLVDYEPGSDHALLHMAFNTLCGYILKLNVGSAEVEQLHWVWDLFKSFFVKNGHMMETVMSNCNFADVVLHSLRLVVPRARQCVFTILQYIALTGSDGRPILALSMSHKWTAFELLSEFWIAGHRNEAMADGLKRLVAEYVRQKQFWPLRKKQLNLVFGKLIPLAFNLRNVCYHPDVWLQCYAEFMNAIVFQEDSASEFHRALKDVSLEEPKIVESSKGNVACMLLRALRSRCERDCASAEALAAFYPYLFEKFVDSYRDRQPFDDVSLIKFAIFGYSLAASVDRTALTNHLLNVVHRLQLYKAAQDVDQAVFRWLRSALFDVIDADEPIQGDRASILQNVVCTHPSIVLQLESGLVFILHCNIRTSPTPQLTFALKTLIHVYAKTKRLGVLVTMYSNLISQFAMDLCHEEVHTLTVEALTASADQMLIACTACVESIDSLVFDMDPVTKEKCFNLVTILSAIISGGRTVALGRLRQVKGADIVSAFARLAIVSHEHGGKWARCVSKFAEVLFSICYCARAEHGQLIGGGGGDSVSELMSALRMLSQAAKLSPFERVYACLLYSVTGLLCSKGHLLELVSEQLAIQSRMGRRGFVEMKWFTTVAIEWLKGNLLNGKPVTDGGKRLVCMILEDDHSGECSEVLYSRVGLTDAALLNTVLCGVVEFVSMLYMKLTTKPTMHSRYYRVLINLLFDVVICNSRRKARTVRQESDWQPLMNALCYLHRAPIETLESEQQVVLCLVFAGVLHEMNTAWTCTGEVCRRQTRMQMRQKCLRLLRCLLPLVAESTLEKRWHIVNFVCGMVARSFRVFPSDGPLLDTTISLLNVFCRHSVQFHWPLQCADPLEAIVKNCSENPVKWVPIVAAAWATFVQALMQTADGDQALYSYASSCVQLLVQHLRLWVDVCVCKETTVATLKALMGTLDRLDEEPAKRDALFPDNEVEQLATTLCGVTSNLDRLACASELSGYVTVMELIGAQVCCGRLNDGTKQLISALKRGPMDFRSTSDTEALQLMRKFSTLMTDVWPLLGQAAVQQLLAPNNRTKWTSWYLYRLLSAVLNKSLSKQRWFRRLVGRVLHSFLLQVPLIELDEMLLTKTILCRLSTEWLTERRRTPDRLVDELLDTVLTVLGCIDWKTVVTRRAGDQRSAGLFREACTLLLVILNGDRSSLVMEKMPSLLTVLNGLQVAQNLNCQGATDSCKAMAFHLRKVVDRLANYAEDMKRVGVYVVADFVHGQSEKTICPESLDALLPAYRRLHACFDQPALDMLATNLGSPAELEIYTNLFVKF